MLIYNRITELVYSQFLILFLLEIASILLAIFLFKKKISLKLVLFSSIIAFILSLLSMVVINGSYGCTAYHERFGWPFPFQWISRSIDDISSLWGTRFDVWKFIANTIYWGIFPLLILFEILSKKRNKKFQLFVIGLLSLYILLTLIFSYINTQKKIETMVEPIQETKIEDSNHTYTELEKQKKEAIETAYPEFKDFEKDNSFAGTSVKVQTYENNHYFGYIVHGSGVPIASATCFKVDHMFRVYKVGEFPDPLDSYSGYNDIDTISCTGIK